METLGQYLKREREFRKITPQEVATATRIKVGYLEALEADRFAELPGSVFIKGFLRSYACFVGLNVDEVLLRYEDQLQHGEEQPSDRPPSYKKFAGLKPRRKALAITVILFLLLLVAIYVASR
ncbi:MAG: helix-turn-helix domain-containing protein [Deltaproteobacteria bacterium]|nr:helix-turn-helix domain-containing protein [Deltaproteobacteria bacterium]